MSINKSLKIPDNSFNELVKNKENEIYRENEFKNPYLKKDDVPIIEIKDINEMIYNEKIKYKIDKYLNEIINTTNDFLDDSIYNFCKECRKNMNKYFCGDCNKNLCEKCCKQLKCFENDHATWDLNNILKKNYDKNIEEIKNILNYNIIHMKETDEIIKKIIQYIDINIINNDKFIENENNLITDDFLLNKNIENKDILLINQIISEEYLNYFHYKNIENILNYLKNTYYIKDNNNYTGYGKMICENGVYYYFGEFKNSLRDGKGILYFNFPELLLFGDLEDDKLKGEGGFDCQIYNYYIGEWKDNLKNGKGILFWKDGAKYQGDFINDLAYGYGKMIYNNGKYYIGKRKNGLRHGKGIM